MTLKERNILKERSAQVTDSLANMYIAAARIYTSGDVMSVADSLAMNFLLDRSAEAWKKELANLKVQVGTCDTSSAILPTGALSGDFTWRCEHGRLKGSLLLAPTKPPLIQSLEFTRANP